MKVLHVIDSLGRGGAERQLVNLLPHLPPHIESRVVSLGADLALADHAVAAGVRVDSLGIESLFEWPRAVRPLRRIVRAWRPDIVHTRLTTADLAGRVAAARHAAVVSSIESPVYDTAVREADAANGRRWKREVVRLADITSARLADVTYIACAPHVAASAKRALRVAPDRMTVVANSTSVPDHPPRPGRSTPEDRTTRLVIAGKLAPPKGHADLLAALPAVLREHPRVRLQIVGSGPLESELRRLSCSLGIAECVDWLGTRADVPELLRAADLVVLPSLWEGLSLVVLEAMAAGAAIVAADIPAMRDALVDGESGVLVDARNPHALASAINRVLSDHALRSSLGRNAWARARSRFDVRVAARELAKVYDEVRARRQGAVGRERVALTRAGGEG